MKVKSFFDWYTENEREAGALISMTVAGKMLGTTRQYIQNLVTSDKIKIYTYENIKFVGLRDIEKILKKRIERIKSDKRIKRTADTEKHIDYEEMVKIIKENYPDKAKELGL